MLRDVASVYVAYSPDAGFPGATETIGSFARLGVESGARRLVLLSGRGEAGAGRSEQAVRDSGADAEIAKAAGREAEYLPVTPQELESGMVEAGLPAEFAARLTGLFTVVLDGRNAHLNDGVQRALGREPRDFADYARDAATAVWDA